MYKVKKIYDAYESECKGKDCFTWAIVDENDQVVDAGWDRKRDAQDKCNMLNGN